MTEPFNIEDAEGQDITDLEQQENQPMLKIIQSGSAEIKASHKDYEKKKIEGAVEGDIVFGKDATIIGQPIEAIFVGQSSLVKAEWKPKDAGGGLVGHHSLAVANHPQYSRKRNDRDTAFNEFLGANQLKDTIYGYLLFKREVEGEIIWEKAIIAFSGTGLSCIKDYNKMLRNTDLNYEAADGTKIKPKFIFCHRVKISTFANNNTSGDWMGWKIDHDGLLDLTADEALLSQGQEAGRACKADLPKLANVESYALTDSAAATAEDEPF